MIRDILVSYDTYVTEIAICKKFNHELSCELKNLEQIIERLNKCISLLSNEDADIIKEIYFEHKSVRMVANKYGYSKSGMQYKRDKIIEKLAQLYDKACKYS